MLICPFSKLFVSLFVSFPLFLDIFWFCFCRACSSFLLCDLNVVWIHFGSGTQPLKLGLVASRGAEVIAPECTFVSVSSCPTVRDLSGFFLMRRGVFATPQRFGGPASGSSARSPLSRLLGRGGLRKGAEPTDRSFHLHCRVPTIFLRTCSLDCCKSERSEGHLANVELLAHCHASLMAARCSLIGSSVSSWLVNN